MLKSPQNRVASVKTEGILRYKTTIKARRESNANHQPAGQEVEDQGRVQVQITAPEAVPPEAWRLYGRSYHHPQEAELRSS